MLVNGDAKALEWMTCLYLSQDQKGMEEWSDPKIDMHSDNQRRFGLPERVVAKVFLFRLIFGGSAYSYALDPDFNYVSSDRRFWQDCIDSFYEKYSGVGRWHSSIVRDVMETGMYRLPTGRIYKYYPFDNGDWPRTKILNYPVQGLGAELMAMARVALHRKMRREELESQIVCTVHDSVLTDGPTKEVDRVVQMYKDVWAELPDNFMKLFGVNFNLPCRVEIQVGMNWGEMEKV